MPQPAASARIFVLRAGSPGSPEWSARVQSGAYLILEGESSIAESFGFRATKENVRISSLEDVHLPKLPIVWEKGLELPRYEVPAEAKVFAKERWTGAPLLAGFRRGAGAVLWLAVSPGERGYERFPYLLHALADLGLDPPFRSTRLWAFFDSSYRLRVDLDYFAARWRNAGICRPARRRLAFLRSRPRARRLPQAPDRRLPRQRHPGLRLARTAPCQRKVLGRSSPVARKNRCPAGCPTRLAQAHESLQPRLLPRRRRRRQRPDRALRLGWRQPGRALLRIARRPAESLPLHPHE